MKHITKKEFKERSTVCNYGNNTRVLFYDYVHFGDISGYKYAVGGFGVTKKEMIDNVYDALIKNEELPYCYEIKVAEKPEDRFKIPIVLNDKFWDYV